MQVIVDKIFTNYWEIGKGEDVILILHGWQRSIDEWIPVAENIYGNYRILILDLPGFGGTSMPDNAYDTYDYATFVEHFLVKLGVCNCILIGHSFGGRLGIILASNTKFINKLILIDSAGIEKKSLVLNLLDFVVKPLSKFILVKIKERFESTDYRSAGKLRKTFVKIINQDLTYLLSKIDVKTIIIWGDKDNILDMRYAKIFKERIRNSIVRVIWGAGHSPHIEKRKAFLDILNEYI